MQLWDMRNLRPVDVISDEHVVDGVVVHHNGPRRNAVNCRYPLGRSHRERKAIDTERNQRRREQHGRSWCEYLSVKGDVKLRLKKVEVDEMV